MNNIDHRKPIFNENYVSNCYWTRDVSNNGMLLQYCIYILGDRLWCEVIILASNYYKAFHFKEYCIFKDILSCCHNGIFILPELKVREELKTLLPNNTYIRWNIRIINDNAMALMLFLSLTWFSKVCTTVQGVWV